MATGPLKLTVRMLDSRIVKGGKYVALCTEDGAPVGKQISCAVTSEAGQMGTITVKFYIDGDQIRFADNDG